MIPELEDVIQHGSPERRASCSSASPRSVHRWRRSRFSEDHVGLFDDVLEPPDRGDRGEGARRAVPIAWRRSAMRRSRWCAGSRRRRYRRSPGRCLTQSSRLDDADLVDIAQTKSQAHLLAISGADGDRASRSPTCWCGAAIATVARSVADNRNAQLSDGSFSRAGRPGACGRRSGREGRAAARHSAAAVPRSAAQGDRRWCSSGCSPPPKPRRKPRSGACSRRSSNEVGSKCRAARLRRRAARGRWRCVSRAGSTSRRSWNSPRTASYEETVAALALPLRGVRSRSWIG